MEQNITWFRSRYYFIFSIALARPGSILSFPLLLLDEVVFGLSIALARPGSMLSFPLQQEQWIEQNATWSSKSNGKDTILPGLARAIERTKYYLVGSNFSFPLLLLDQVAFCLFHCSC
jgi:hypothetical protein